ncbi:phospholipid hydroperoxide glutathione peroxidase-like [Sitophilus oryzae]|uniref:Glutathione peroxidase n=1 Tax=Sitophilus oryzae TaxID=7048 RepID=A0A6J2X467_SITOR|nr:phospholipid hydroperoxide glutathione peroxidase-like [Sitophilus oryzae]
MLKILCFLLAISALSLSKNPDDYKKAESVYDFTATDISGNEVSLDKYKGHVLVIINVATNCTMTERNYKQLNEIYDKFGQSKGLRILAFPCNQFMNQEPGTNAEIAAFAKSMNVKFDMFSKIEVNGDGAHPLYKYLKFKQPGTKENDDSIEWNFAKFIIDKNGQVVERHVPQDNPLDLIPSLEKYF